MLTELYIETLLVDEELADMVWAAWANGMFQDAWAIIWWSIIATSSEPDYETPDIPIADFFQFRFWSG